MSLHNFYFSKDPLRSRKITNFLKKIKTDKFENYVRVGVLCCVGLFVVKKRGWVEFLASSASPLGFKCGYLRI